jgi:very-short-patch-repair endonuclease
MGVTEGSISPEARAAPDALAARAAAVQRSAKTWTGALVDLTGRNNLLYYRDLKVGTLDLGDIDEGLLYSLLAGRSLPLSRLFPDEERRADAIKRARTVRNRAQEHFEERGLETLYLACGMATWANQKTTTTPCAPVLLVPARLAARGAAQDDFDVSITGELEVNPTLLHMLAVDFNCLCDPEDLLASAGMEGAIDTPEELEIAFSWLREKCSTVPGFGVSDRFILGTFSYAKLPMVKDIEGSLDAMMQHELIAALAGDKLAQAAIAERRPSVNASDPNHIPPADEFLILDADASQNYAINAVLGGQDLVIKGPPGTGKSQTIANLIATLAARGQRVLFVAEKRAAIEAVIKRLDKVGLGELVLDLHGGVSSKREVAQSLAAALATNSRIPRQDVSAVHRVLATRREELNSYSQALHEPRLPWGVSVHETQTLLLELNETVGTPVRFRGAHLEQLGRHTYEQASDDLRAYVGLGGLTIRHSGSPWASSSIASVQQAQEAQRIVDRLRVHTLPTVEGRLEAAAASTRLSTPATVAGWEKHLATWEGLERCLATFDVGVFAEPLGELTENLAPLGAGTGSRLSAMLTDGDYRASRKSLTSHLREGVKPKPAGLLQAAQEARGLAGDWQQLALDGSAPMVPSDLAELRSSFGQLQDELLVLARYLAVARLDGSSDQLRAQFDALLADTATLGKLPKLHQLGTSLGAAGLGDLVAELGARSMSPDAAVEAFKHAWLSSIAEHVRLTDARVGAFNGDQHSRTVAEFQVADRAHIETTAQRVRRLVAEHATKAQDELPEQAMLIRDQAARKRKHLAIRELFSGAPDVMTALKPCWVMSPLVVSQLLPSDKQYFDVTVFDEASQVRPADAIPAILRGRRLVVAGDEKQLPPTSFFTGSDAEGESHAVGDDIVVDTGHESILEALVPFLGGFRMLEWHYRSRDERLIAFSNAHLYDRGLTTFPGVEGPDCLRHILVPHTLGEATSDVSAADEVHEVVRLILDHAETRPDESLGVITMGIKHMDRIDEALRRQLEGRTDLDEFFDEARPERFFVKNLERVQGDERDAIILSVGYGKNADGRLLYRFGPLNQEGGERRLNVAVTRARSRMTLVSSFAAADMDPDRSKARGVQLLRFYLQYAESRGEKLGEAADLTPKLNPFEVDVRDTLTRAGIPLCAQYGASGFRIDFAAKHPQRPGQMVLAIECDGASYHSSQTARDRDRLRQEHLERLGWTFHRIWSQDWFANELRETEKAVAAYQRAVRRADEEDDEPSARSEDSDSGGGPPTPGVLTPDRGPRPPVRAGLPITEYRHTQIRSVVRWVQSDTLLRTHQQLLSDVMTELGFQKRGTRIVAAIEAAIAAEQS